MVEVTSTEAQRNFGLYRELAEGAHAASEPVTVLHGDKPSVVILSAAGFARLKQRDKRSMATEDLPEWLVDQIAASEMDPRFSYLDEA
ncbi:MAG: type II toxin-antitoxin system Phd/YefM family antitoxin [Acetobacteraceae bacterium]|nr:type II toxin-antitoxin system Phd/YefM family antitoxin [Acetobacteraceae bacterium]